MKKRPWQRLLLPVLLIAAPVAVAKADAWDRGRHAFTNGNYGAALTFFQAARDQGSAGPAVHYNIAVSQYRLGDYVAAGDTFSLIASRYPKMRGLAEYNLGLVAQRLDNPASARAHYLRAYQFSADDQTIRTLASRRLRELESGRPFADRWSGAAGIRVGHDDNVVLRDEAGLPAGTTTDSPLLAVFAAVQGPRSGSRGLRVDASAYLRRYSDAGNFDQSEFRGGLFYEWRKNNWRIELGTGASVGTLGGETFDRKIRARSRIIRYLGRRSVLDVRYTYDDISDSNSLFTGIAGSRQQFDARYRWYVDSHRVQLRYWIESNDRIDAGVSPDRTRLAVEYRFQPREGMGYEAGLDWRSSDYNELATPREEDLITLRAALTYSFWQRWMAVLELQVSDSDSSDSAFAYTRRQLTLGITRLF